MVLIWKKCPSTLTGGKKYFWVTHFDISIFNRKTIWIVWDRVLKSWIVTDGEKQRHKVKTVAQGKKDVLKFFQLMKK